MPITGSPAHLVQNSLRKRIARRPQTLVGPADSQGTEPVEKKNKKASTATHRIGYHELSGRTVASEGGQPVNFLHNPRRFELKPGLAKRLHERFTQ